MPEFPDTSSAPAPQPLAVPARSNNNAVLALILAASSLFLFFTAIPAIIFGNRAKQEIASTNEPGEPLARGAVIISWVVLAMGVITILAYAIMMGTLATAITSTPGLMSNELTP